MIKQREANSWKSVSYAKSITGAQTYTKFPIVLRTTEQSIPTWSVKGNTIQDGTPTPSNPVMPQGTGNKTANLLTEIVQGGVRATDGNLSSSSNRVRTNYISVTGGKTYTVSCDTLLVAVICAYTNTVYDSTLSQLSAASQTVTIPQGANQIAISFMKTNGTDVTPSEAGQIMLNEGSTAQSYEPYGYKIPISSGGVTNNIYLSEPLMGIATADTIVSSGTVTRAYQIVELNSSMYIEAYNATWGTAFTISISNVSSGGEYATIDAVCSHYPKTTRNNIYRNNVNGICYSGSTNAIIINDVDCATVQDFKNFITAQKEANTPITIVIAATTPTTETVTAPTIPTPSSPTTIDVNTSVKPSEMSLTYDGYKICKKQKYQNDAWT